MYSNEVLNAMANAGERTPAILSFNKTNGAYVNSIQGARLDELGGADIMDYVEVDSFSDKLDTVVGFYPDFKIVARDTLKPVYYEKQFDSLMAGKITRTYAVTEQVNVLGRAIMLLAKEHNIVLEELEEMLDFIQLAKDANRERKEAAANDPDIQYISNAELDRRDAEMFAGALHEEFGPRADMGGRVFS